MPSENERRAAAEALATETVHTAEVLATETTHTAEDLATETARKATILADALAGALGKVTAQLHDQDTYNQAAAAYAKRSRGIIIALIVSFAADIAITAFLGVTAERASSTNTALHQQQYQSCLNTDQTRAGAIAIWERNIAAFHDNPAGAAFLGLVRTVYAPEDCTR